MSLERLAICEIFETPKQQYYQGMYDELVMRRESHQDHEYFGRTRDEVHGICLFYGWN